MIKTVVQNTTLDAEAAKVIYQNVIEDAEQGAEIVAVTANLDKAAAIIIPVPRLTEFNSASAVDKVRFVLVAQKSIQALGAAGAYVELFELEYTKEFG